MSKSFFISYTSIDSYSAASSFSYVTQLYFAYAIIRAFTVAARDKIRHTNIYSNYSMYINTITSLFIFFSFFAFSCAALYLTLRNRYSKICKFFLRGFFFLHFRQQRNLKRRHSQGYYLTIRKQVYFNSISVLR